MWLHVFLQEALYLSLCVHKYLTSITAWGTIPRKPITNDKVQLKDLKYVCTSREAEGKQKPIGG